MADCSVAAEQGPGTSRGGTTPITGPASETAASAASPASA